MSLRTLLSLGVEAALAERGEDLEGLVAGGAHPDTTVEHLRQTLEALPGLLSAVELALQRETAPLFARTLFMIVIGYLLREDDLIPMHGDQPLLGLLDDTYLLHRAAQELREELEEVEMRSVDGGTALLSSVLPRDVVRELDRAIARARGEAEAIAERRGS
ncbi:MAG: hypothetical protein ACFCGT_08280 [Sandaracinaceae bacterium]